MISAIIILSIILLVLTVIIVKRELDFAEERKIYANITIGEVSSFAISLRKSKMDGGAPSVRPIKNKLLRAYRLISAKVTDNIDLYEYEKWIYENYYKILSRLDQIDTGRFTLLPHVSGKARILYVADFILTQCRDKVSYDIVSKLIKEFNQYTPLDSEEIFALNDALYYLLSQKLSDIAYKSIEYHSMYKAAKRFRFSSRNARRDSYIYWRSRLDMKDNDCYQESGIEDNIEFSFSKTLFEHNLTVQNCISSIFDIEYQINKAAQVSLSETDKIMSADKPYREMDISSKASYLETACDLAHKYNVSEILLVKKAMELGEKNSIHFGEYLFDARRQLKSYIRSGTLPEKKVNYTRGRQYLFINTVWISAILVSIIMAFFGAFSVWGAVLFALMSLFAALPVAENIAIAFSKLLLTDRPIAKLDNDKVGDDNKTLVVIPCYVGGVVDVDNTVKSIIRIREGNAGDNISFALLVDYRKSATESEVQDYDLNRLFKQKLQCYSDINLFVRKRTKINGVFAAYERKRGAIMALCDMLLSKNTQSFSYIMRDNILETPRFVVTLDSDNELMPGTILNAVNTMLHPLNSKYTLMTFRPKYNLYSAKSLLAKEYYYDSGFDRYGSSDSFYSALSSYAIFNGKGIFRLDSFYSKLYNTLPSGKVLSHDIIEGAIVSSGELAEPVYEDIPSSIAADISRRNRWQKGDLMLLPFLGGKIRNDNGVIKRIDKEPIYDFVMLQNAFKVFEHIGLLSLLVTAMYFRSIIMAIPFIALYALPYLIRLSHTLFTTTKAVRVRYVLYDIFGIAVQMTVKFFLLPFYAVNSLMVIARTLYCVILSPKSRLNWRTYSSAQGDGSFTAHLKMILPSLIISALMSLLFIPNIWLTGYFALCFAVSIAIYATCRETSDNYVLSGSDKDLLESVGKKTYSFFTSCQINGIIADNYQVKPYKGLSGHTSPTNIGYSLLAEVCAFNLGYIGKQTAQTRIADKLKKVQSLRKYKGHLYNWYDINTKQILPPNFISSVDSGNFVACLIVLKSFMKEQDIDGVETVEELIENTDFDFLFDRSSQQFYIGYNTVDKSFTGHYDMLASEARILYYIYSAYSHNTACYTNLKRPISNLYGNTVLSWSGTMFEYLMPRLFMAPPRYSLMDRTEHNVFRLAGHKKCHGVFGISESGYYKYDDKLNYQYKAFGLSQLAVRNTPDRCVISPYSTFLGLTVNAKKALFNLKVLELEDMIGEYGYYEAVDFTRKKQIIYSYMAHHQGMILSGITNLLCNNRISDYFMNDSKMSGARLLLTERNIETKGIDKICTDFVYENANEKNLTDSDSAFGVLSNGKYTVYSSMYRQNVSCVGGNSIARFAPYEKVSGFNSYVLRDIGGKAIGYRADRGDDIAKQYSHRFTAYCHSFTNNNENMTEYVYVPNCYNGEVRCFEYKNDSDSVMTRFFAGYADITLCHPRDDQAHPAFSDMFLSTAKQGDDCVIYTRKSRDNSGYKYLGIKIIGLQNVVIETNKSHCIDKVTHNVRWDGKIYDDSFGDIVTPAFSYIGDGVIMPKSAHKYYAVMLYSESLSELDSLLAGIKDSRDCELLIESANVAAQNVINRKISDCAHLKFTDRLIERLWYGSYSESALDSISGIEYSELMNRISADHSAGILLYRQDINAENLDKAVNTVDLLKDLPTPMKMVVAYSDTGKNGISKDNVERLKGKGVFVTKDKDLIEDLSRLAMCDITDLRLQPLVFNAEPMLAEISDCNQVTHPDIVYDIKYGGFTRNGYLINDYTEKPYSNVICMKYGGFIATASGVAYSYNGNSRNNKIISPFGDMYRDIPGGSIDIEANGVRWRTDRLYRGGYVEHRLGMTAYKMSYQGIVSCTECYVIFDGKAQVYELCLENISDSDKDINISLRLRLALGVDYNPRFIKVADRGGEIVFTNVLTGQTVHLAAVGYPLKTERLADGSYICSTNTVLKSGRAERVYFVLYGDILRQINIADITLEKAKSLDYFASLNKIKINTKNKSLDYLFNKCLMYQTVSSRLNGRCGFYQIGGATGFRDQLQDCLSYIYSNPEYVRNHILSCAKRQFIQGDVLHWWHEPNIGVRTHISDDKLFLPYVTAEYIRITGDNSILKETVSYLESEDIPDDRHDLYKPFEVSSMAESLYAHCVRAIDSSLRYGQNNLLLIGDGDWNDALNNIGDKNAGESVWLTMFAYYVIDAFSPYLEKNLKDRYFTEKDKLKNGINAAFHINRYARAVTKDGEWLGLADSAVCQIDLLCQSFAAICGACSEDNVRLAIESTESLVDREKGLVKLLYPPFNSAKYYGYISNYPSGVRENGGQYTHAVAWYIKALSLLDKDKALRMLNLVNPINKCIKNPEYDVEPYVMSADVYTVGKGGWTWYTGSSSWFYKVILEDILGVRICGNSIEVYPHYYAELGDIVNLNIELKDKKIRLSIVRAEDRLLKVNGMINTQINSFRINLDGKETEYDITVQYKA